MSSDIYFINSGRTPQTDRENLQAHSSKSTAGFGRVHFRPKHALGDLQNVIHNKTPLKGSTKQQIYTPSPFVSKNEVKTSAPVKKKPTSKFLEADLEDIWLESSLMPVSEFKCKIEKNDEKEKKHKEDAWKRLHDDLSRVHKKKSNEYIFGKSQDMGDLLDELCIMEPSGLALPNIPDLPIEDFENNDFLKW